MKNFALIGAAGFIAPRHLKAIKDSGNNLVAALDKHDCVGILDSYFPDADFFTEFERFDRHIDKLKRLGTQIDFVSVCTPNYLHDSHIRFGLRIGADVICEKPLVLNPWNLDGLKEIENETGKKIYTILQLRHHPEILALKKKVDGGQADKKYNIKLKYITSRGKWYQYSWKGDESKSGGIATNIGVHFFDMLIWIFGKVLAVEVSQHSSTTAIGKLKLEKADVEWFLSIEADTLPEAVKNSGKRTFRSLNIDGEELEFSEGFTDLHTICYKEILNNSGFGLEDARQAIDLIHQVRSYKI